MSRTAAERWLEERAHGVPPRLLQRMRGALADVTAVETVAAQLGEAAITCLRAALSEGDGRPGALDLLAADALLTCGCEAAAEEETGAVARFAVDFGADRLATLLPGP